MIRARNLGPGVVSMRAIQVEREIAQVEQWSSMRRGGLGCLTSDGRPADGRLARGGMGELTMPQQHVFLATGSFALGALAMHLLHRYKVMR